MIAILQGDDTAANGRTISLKCPDVDIGDGYEIGFDLFGISMRGDYAPGGEITFDYTREQTSKFPLGVSYGRTYLIKDDLMQTISNTIPVLVTDSVERAGSGSQSMNLSVKVHTGVQHIDKEELTTASNNGDVKALVNAILQAINGATP